MLIHDVLKIKYVELGYIKKNYPYHLISDEEMFNAFIDLGNDDFNARTTMIDPEVRFFDDNYPNPFVDIFEGDLDLTEVYNALKQYIKDSINDYLRYCDTLEAASHQIPPWVYTYMLGEVIYDNSEYLDKQDLLALLGCSNLDNEFTKTACAKCYSISLQYVSMLVAGTRPPTIFGEPHVIKNLRLEV